nr:hypothetical protein [Corynebacterium sp. HMSC28B08]
MTNRNCDQEGIGSSIVELWIWTWHFRDEVKTYGQVMKDSGAARVCESRVGFFEATGLRPSDRHVGDGGKEIFGGRVGAPHPLSLKLNPGDWTKGLLIFPRIKPIGFAFMNG